MARRRATTTKTSKKRTLLQGGSEFGVAKEFGTQAISSVLLVRGLPFRNKADIGNQKYQKKRNEVGCGAQKRESGLSAESLRPCGLWR
jgi:hypothetical protein